ncbi:TPA: hypothetical protein SB604_000902 [Yersinia enterocolitica]|nr:hypothetical protein [Yersinia enterocolitica]
MMKLLSVFIIALTLSTVADASRGRKPCSGSKGGISHCTSDGRFLCNDGSISQSKKYCDFGRSSNTTSLSDYSEVKKTSVNKSPKPVKKKQPKATVWVDKPSKSEAVPQPSQPKAPVCAPIHLSAQQGYTHLPICQTDGTPY